MPETGALGNVCMCVCMYAYLHVDMYRVMWSVWMVVCYKSPCCLILDPPMYICISSSTAHTHTHTKCTWSAT